jgi:hypothetical protein
MKQGDDTGKVIYGFVRYSFRALTSFYLLFKPVNCKPHPIPQRDSGEMSPVYKHQSVLAQADVCDSFVFVAKLARYMLYLQNRGLGLPGIR